MGCAPEAAKPCCAWTPLCTPGAAQRGWPCRRAAGAGDAGRCAGGVWGRAGTWMVPIRRLVSRRSMLTRALMYSPVAASEECSAPLSYSLTTASGSPRLLRSLRCEACARQAGFSCTVGLGGAAAGMRSPCAEAQGCARQDLGPGPAHLLQRVPGHVLPGPAGVAAPGGQPAARRGAWQQVQGERGHRGGPLQGQGRLAEARQSLRAALEPQAGPTRDACGISRAVTCSSSLRAAIAAPCRSAGLPEPSEVQGLHRLGCLLPVPRTTGSSCPGRERAAAVAASAFRSQQQRDRAVGRMQLAPQARPAPAELAQAAAPLCRHTRPARRQSRLQAQTQQQVRPPGATAGQGPALLPGLHSEGAPARTAAQEKQQEEGFQWDASNARWKRVKAEKNKDGNYSTGAAQPARRSPAGTRRGRGHHQGGCLADKWVEGAGPPSRPRLGGSTRWHPCTATGALAAAAAGPLSSRAGRSGR